MSIRYITRNGKYAIVYAALHGDWLLYEVQLGVDTDNWNFVCELIEGPLGTVARRAEEMVTEWDKRV